MKAFAIRQCTGNLHIAPDKTGYPDNTFSCCSMKSYVHGESMLWVLIRSAPAHVFVENICCGDSLKKASVPTT